MAQKLYIYIVNDQRNWRLRRCKKVSDYVEEMPQSHTVNRPTVHVEETQNNTMLLCDWLFCASSSLTVGWSAVCDCGIPSAYSLKFYSKISA